MLVYAVDVIFVARLGAEALAASSLAVSLFGLIAVVASGLTGLVAPLIAAELGRRRHAVREVRRSVRMALWLAMARGLGRHGRCRCISASDHAGDRARSRRVAARAGAFLAVLMWAMVPMLVANVLRTFVAALGRPIFATAITALAIGVNVLGNYALVFGHFGAPALGLDGSALSSVLITAAASSRAYVVAIASRPAPAPLPVVRQLVAPGMAPLLRVACASARRSR